MKFAPSITAVALMLAASLSQALEIQTYTPSALASAQQAGNPVALHFHASWCPTCRAQEASFKRLQADKDLDITVLVADYDQERELRRQLGVRSQSVVIVYRGDKETARAGGETAPDKLKALLKTAF